MLPKIPFEELLQALEGHKNVVFDTCPELLANYYHPAEVNLISRLTDLAQAFASVENIIKENEAVRCRYLRSLFKGVQEAAFHYKREIRNLENELVDPSLSLTAFVRMERFAWAMERIRTLLDTSLSEGIVAAWEVIHKHSMSSDPLTQKIFPVIRGHALRPLFDDIWYWMIHGVLLDKCSSKFFICTKDAKAELVAEQIPSFLGKAMGDKIFFCGRVAQSLKKKDQDQIGILKDEKNYLQEYVSITSKTSLDKFQFETLLEKIRSEHSQLSLHHLLNDFNFWAYMRILKELLLAGNEDLITCLLENLYKNVNRKSKNVKSWQKGYNVSLNNTLVDYYSEEKLGFVIDFMHCDIRSIPFNDEFITFNINFSLPEIIGQIITKEHILCYNKIFNFCLLMYQSKQTLNKAWYRLMVDKNKQPPYWSLLHKLLLILGHLYYFYKVNIIERLYFDFCQQTSLCQDIEAFKSFHSQFITKLTTQSMLDIDVVERTLIHFFRYVGKATSFMDENLNSSDIMALEAELSQLCMRLDSLFVTLKAHSICPTLPYLLTQIHNCLTPSTLMSSR